MDVAQTPKDLEYRLPHVRVEVHGVYELDLLRLGDVPDGEAQFLERLPEALAAVASDEDERLFHLEPGE